MKTLLLFLATSFGAFFAIAQQKSWDTYSKSIDNDNLVIRVNSSLYDVEPLTEAPFLVKITHGYAGRGAGKLPTRTEAATLVRIQDVTKQLISKKTNCYLAGTAAHNNKCEIYFYVKDTTGLRALVQRQYKALRYKKYDIDIKSDNKWEGYFTVLYPGEEQRQMIYYKRVVARLLKSGDKLRKPHKVTHWAYFKNEEDMRTCQKYLHDKKYTLIASVKKPYARYQVRFYHVIPITEQAILGSIRDIKGQLAINAGSYGGWQTIVAR